MVIRETLKRMGFPMIILFKLAVFEAWVLGVFLASWRTERTFDFVPGSQELLLLGFAALFALHNATLGIFRIGNRRGQEFNAIALAVFAAAALWSWIETPELDGRVTLFWALGPMGLSLMFARAAWFWRQISEREAE